MRDKNIYWINNVNQQLMSENFVSKEVFNPRKRVSTDEKVILLEKS